MPVTAKLRADIEEVLKDVFSKQETMQTICEKITDVICENMDKQLSEVKEELNNVKAKYEILNTKYIESEHKLQQKIDKIEQHSRRKNVRIFGLAEVLTDSESVKENVEATAIAFCKDKLGVKLVAADIVRCHRTGKQQDGKSRAIYLQLSNYKKKIEIMANKKKLKGKGIIVREDLTRIRLKLYQDAIQKYGLKETWTNDGQICVYMNGKIKTLEI